MKHLYAATCSVALYLVVTLQTSSAAPIQTKEDAWKFLTEFGYVPEASDSQNVMDESTAFRKFLMEMQYMAGLNQTGELDEPTIATLNTPRCSVKDNVGFSNHARRRKRYAIEGSRWRNLQVSFGVTTFTNQLNQEAQKSTFRTAFQYWAQASGLSFRETTASTGNDIDIKFAKRAHGDASPFDGIGGVLAHAYFPSSGGDTHFDDDEQWTLNTNRGTNLLQVATHEFGHSLGLGHSNVPGSIMYAYYNGYTPNLQLTPDDIAGIQYLYGPPPSGTGNAATTSTRSTTTRPRAPVVTTLPRAISTTYRFTSGSRPAICNYPKVDAIVVVDGVTYAFSDSYYYELNDQGITPGYPKTIVSKWSQINGQVDAALYYEPVTTSDQYGRTVITKPGYLFLFQGSRYWKYQNVDTLESGYPRQIREGFPGIPDNIDAAFIWSGNGRVYFMKGSNYYRYSPMIGTDAGYPRTISSAWGGLPSSGITAAFKWTNSRTYFFVGTQYYRLNDVTISVDSGYPRNTGEWWFGCSSLGGNLKVEEDDERNGFIEIENSNTTAPSRLIISGNGDSGNGGAGAPSHLANIHAICVLLITLFVRAAISSNLFVAELELKSV